MLPDFLIIPKIVHRNKNLTPSDWIVYAAIYYFEHLRDGRCTASNESLARIAEISERAVMISLEKLEREGYIVRSYKGEKNSRRESIHSTIRFSRDVKGEESFTQERTGVHPRGRTGVHQSNNITTKKRDHIPGVAFELFWKAYPKKVEKKKSELKWSRLAPDVQRLILEDIPRRAAGRKWLAGYVENPLTYLNGERWNDEIESVSGTGPRSAGSTVISE